MKARIALGTIIMMFLLAIPVNAGGKGELQEYFSNTAKKVKASENASEKRKILNESFQNMSTALDKVQSLGMISKKDRIGIDHFKTALQDKQDELAGRNGYERVSDTQLNAFSDYVVQDMEQASGVVTISIVTLILLAILLVLIVR